MSRRTERLNELIREELSDLLFREARDPRLSRFISITRVDVSVMDEAEAQKETLKALNAAAAFFHRELKSRLDLRRIPFLTFRLDTSIEEAAQILALMDKVAQEDKPTSDG